MAHTFDISPNTLKVPDIDSYIGFMHTLFTLEDVYGIKIDETDKGICLRPCDESNSDFMKIRNALIAWKEQAGKLRTSEITREEYDQWRYKYPEFDTTGGIWQSPV